MERGNTASAWDSNSSGIERPDPATRRTSNKLFIKTQPLLVVFVGPNGAGKSTLRNLLYRESPFPFVNADLIAADLRIGAYEAACLAERARLDFFEARASFMFETELSDPVGAKVGFLIAARSAGYRVIVHFVGLASPEQSAARVFQRVKSGGHDVPGEKIQERFPRILENLARLLGRVDDLTIYDNSSPREPYRIVARFSGENLTALSPVIPAWLGFLDLPSRATDDTSVIGT
jgi:predicted ABC-type ATPase